MGDFVLVSVRRPRLLSTLAPGGMAAAALASEVGRPYKRIARAAAARRPKGL